MVAAWQRFWFSPIPPHVYALLRIALGVLGLIVLYGLRNFHAFWDLDGMVSVVGLESVKAYATAHELGSVIGRVLYFTSIVAFLLMTAGFRSSFSVPFALVMLLVQLSWNHLPLSGAHPAMQGMLFCLIWADCGAVWSIDSWLAHRRGSDQAGEESIAPLRLVRYQIALIYVTSGLYKLYNPLWRDGAAVHYVLNNNIFARFPGWPASLDPLASVANYLTLGWELAFGLMLLWKPTRILAIVSGICIHLGMGLLMEVGPFHFVMLAGYLSFLDPARVPRTFGRLIAFHSTPIASVPHISR